MKNIVLSNKFHQIKLLILDVDGVLTDGRVWYSADGEVLQVFYVQDGLGIKRLLEAGIEVAIISSRENRAVFLRARELGILHIFQGEHDKSIPYEQLLLQLHLEEKMVAYVGDDLSDLPVMQRVGLAIAVANAVPEIHALAHWSTKKIGGRGAVREVCDSIVYCHE
ncbi:KdsC family phosphatase [Coxiella endosymbiont of Amblyomma americanum]|uniref:KdsC family phosphatase n=1 Tax=Coxiella endosymbiont of Amblyomma americanum TaxID=325775 RepID=UPI00057C7348|nr:HAD-IIIA family hydrolase [Coxiella endosymbiont of Amblyomma americanum]AUJ59030.1 phenylphosphate carboxylase subunit delta [Coxiella-like endosymbiont of Amblyomma americanum]